MRLLQKEEEEDEAEVPKVLKADIRRQDEEPQELGQVLEDQAPLNLAGFVWFI